MPFLDRRTISVLSTIVFFAVVLVVIYVARAALIIFCFSILFAYLIDPLVRFLQRHSLVFRNLRGPHVAESYLALLVVIVLTVYAIMPRGPSRTAKLIQEIPTLTDKLATGEIADEMAQRYGWSDAQALRVKSFLVQRRSIIQNFMADAARFASSALGALAVIPILAIFFLKDGPKLADQVIGLIATKNNHERLQSLAAELNVMLQHYIRAKVTLGGLSFASTSVALLISGFPHAVGLGLLAGALEFIPIIGWMMAAASILTLGVLTHQHWIWMAAFLGVWRVLMDYWIAPRVFGRQLEIHPLLAIFALMVGGAVGGFVGVYLALPIAAVMRVVWKRVCTPGSESSDPAPVATARARAGAP